MATMCKQWFMSTLVAIGLCGSLLGMATAQETDTATVFDLNGTYTDGGSARPRISNVNDILTIDMSSQHRPTATGAVINSDTIVVIFPDDATYVAKLVAPGTIRWSNNSTWQKIVTTVVPDVRGDRLATARRMLIAAGLSVGRVTYVIDRTCNDIGTVIRQNPTPGTPVEVGLAVNLSIGLRPPPPFQCP